MSEEGLPHAENPEQKRIGIFISVLAVIMAIVSAATNKQANQTLAKKVEFSNGYAFYQAKKQRSFMNEIELKRIQFELAGAPNEAQRQIIEEQKATLTKENDKYKKELPDIQTKADADKAAAEVAEHKHHWFELSEICLHIAVVLCSLVLLTELQIFMKLGMIATVAGLALAAYAQFGNHSHAEHEGDAKHEAGAKTEAPATHGEAKEKSPAPSH